MIRKILATSALAASLAFGAAAYAAPTPDASGTAAAPAKPAPVKAAAKASPAKPPLYARAQAKLKELGDYNGAVNGQRTKMTIASIEKYQKDKGIKVSGRLTPETVKSLGV